MYVVVTIRMISFTYYKDRCKYIYTTRISESDKAFCPLSEALENRCLSSCRLLHSSDNGRVRCVTSLQTTVSVLENVV